MVSSTFFLVEKCAKEISRSYRWTALRPSLRLGTCHFLFGGVGSDSARESIHVQK